MLFGTKAFHSYYSSSAHTNEINPYDESEEYYISRPGFGARGRDTNVLGTPEGEVKCPRAVQQPEDTLPSPRVGQVLWY